jgi:hypothetical protein
MANRTGIATVVLSSLILVALAAGGYWLLRHTEPARCAVCQRGIHTQSRTVILAGGERKTLCCVRCALTASRQLGKPVRLLEVAEFHSSKPLAPQSAYYVEGSRVVLCEVHEPLLDQTKHPYGRTFDRCEPSTHAFVGREDAEAFVRDNGGVVLSWAELVKQVEKQP